MSGPSTAAMCRVVQDLALAGPDTAARTAVYAGLIRTVAHLFGEEDASIDSFPDDAVLQAAQREIPVEERNAMAQWIAESWGWIFDAAEVLDALDDVCTDPFPVIPSAAHSYRTAAEDLALAAGECCAAVSWAGAVAVGRWSRLYGDREFNLRELEARDAVLAAAHRGLPREEALRVARWVIEVWEQVDDAASERAS